MTAKTILPILGLFQEGFYDPLTAKPLCIPLEVVTINRLSLTRSALTYFLSYVTLESNDLVSNNPGTSIANAGTKAYSALALSSLV